jgi:glycosyltransferase involved in cell wall biosynthesis
VQGHKVSIVLPTYNGARFIKQSLESCLRQDYRNLEVVVVDDCSTDYTPQILAPYEAEPRIRLVRHESNRKLPVALNTGFALATGNFLTWTSDDNVYEPNAISTLVSSLEDNPEVGLVYSDYRLIDEDGVPFRNVSAGPPDALRQRCQIACFLYRRSVYAAVGDYDPQLFRIEDYDYWLRVAQKFKLAWLPRVLYSYRRHQASLTSTDNLEERARMFDEVQSRYFGSDPLRRKRVLAQYLMDEAFERHMKGDGRGVLRFGLRGLQCDASFMKNRGVLSILLQALTGRTRARLDRSCT